MARYASTTAEKVAWLLAHPALWQDLPTNESILEPRYRAACLHLLTLMRKASLISPKTEFRNLRLDSLLQLAACAKDSARVCA